MFINMFVIASECSAIDFWRNDSGSFHRRDTLKKAVTVKRLICDNRTDILHTLDQVGRFSNIVSLTARQTKTNQVTQRINRGMNLGTQAPTEFAAEHRATTSTKPAAEKCL